MRLHLRPILPRPRLRADTRALAEARKSTHAQLLREVQQDNNYSDKREKARERACNFRLKGDVDG